MSQELTTEHLRELGKRVRAALPEGLAYCVIIWPMGNPLDCGYFSNSHRLAATAAMQSALGALRKQQGAGSNP